MKNQLKNKPSEFLQSIRKLIFLTVFCTFFPVKSHAEFNIAGSVYLATDTKAMGVSLGGPNFKFNFNENLTMGVSFFPSLRFSWDGTVFPALGSGPFVSWKQFTIATPFYYISNTWLMSGAIGYRF